MKHIHEPRRLHKQRATNTQAKYTNFNRERSERPPSPAMLLSCSVAPKSCGASSASVHQRELATPAVFDFEFDFAFVCGGSFSRGLAGQEKTHILKLSSRKRSGGVTAFAVLSAEAAAKVVASRAAARSTKFHLLAPRKQPPPLPTHWNDHKL